MVEIRQVVHLRHALILVAASILPMVLPTESLAFCPSNGLKCGLGVAGRTHQDITITAVREMYPDLFPGVARSTSMDRALEQIYRANAEVDRDYSAIAAMHFDGESFSAGQQAIASQLTAVRAHLAENDANAARHALGTAFHTIQDFYSHTNWVEMGNSVPHSAVGRPASIAFASRSTATCRFALLCNAENITASQLTSGYYGGNSTPPDGVRKCYHGGLFDMLALPVQADGINKDTTSCDFSPHDHLHNAAADVAEAATKQFINDMADVLDARELRLLFGVGPTLAIAIDTTGSMSPVIDAVKAQAVSIVDGLIGTADEPSKYVLVPFNDPSVGPAFVTTDPAEFRTRITSLSASGGGDCPELAYTGMEQAIANSDDGAMLFVFTDASAKDAAKAFAVASLAKKKNVQITTGLFGSCYSGLLSDGNTGRSLNNFPIGAAPLSVADTSYLSTSIETGGQVFALAMNEAGELTKLASTTLVAKAARLLSVRRDIDAASEELSVPVDSTVDRVFFSISGVSASQVAIKRPSGAAVVDSDPDVTIVRLSDGMLVSVTAPSTGIWKTVLEGAQGRSVSIAVSGSATLRLTSSAFVVEDGRSGHHGYFPISGLPVGGRPALLEILMTEGFSTIAFEARDMSGSLIAPLSLSSDAQGSPLEFFGSATLPNSSFMIYALGTDVQGKVFQRVVPFLVAPQAVEVIAPAAHILARGAVQLVRFRIANRGSAAVFAVAASDDKGFVTSVDRSSIALDAGGEGEILVTLTVPASATPGTSDLLTVTASNATVGNYATVANTIQVAAAPSIVTVMPAGGPDTGGTTVTISGTDFVSGATVLFGGIPATDVEWVSSGTIRAVTPPHQAGIVDVQMINPDTQSATASGSFTYISALASVPTLSSIGLFALVALLALLALGGVGYRP